MKRNLILVLLLILVAQFGAVAVFAQASIPINVLPGPYVSGGTLNATQCAVEVVRIDDATDFYQFTPSSRDVLAIKPWKNITGATVEIDSVPSPTGRFGDVTLTPQSASWWCFFYLQDGAGFVNSATTKVNIHGASGVELAVLRPGSLMQPWNSVVRTNSDGNIYVPQMAPPGPWPTDLEKDGSETGAECLFQMGGSEGNMHLTGREIFFSSPSSVATSVTFAISGVTDQFNRIQDLTFSASGDECTSLFAVWLGHWAGFASSASAEVDVEQGGGYIGAVRIPPSGGLAERLP